MGPGTGLMANAPAVQRFSEGVALDFRFPSAEAAMSGSEGAVISELGALARAQSAPNARDAVRALRPSQINGVAHAGFGVPDVLPFLFGESNLVKPQLILH